jgi:hypothetical protein
MVSATSVETACERPSCAVLHVAEIVIHRVRPLFGEFGGGDRGQRIGFLG